MRAESWDLRYESSEMRELKLENRDQRGLRWESWDLRDQSSDMRELRLNRWELRARRWESWDLRPESWEMRELRHELCWHLKPECWDLRYESSEMRELRLETWDQRGLRITRWDRFQVLLNQVLEGKPHLSLIKNTTVGFYRLWQGECLSPLARPLQTIQLSRVRVKSLLVSFHWCSKKNTRINEVQG